MADSGTHLPDQQELCRGWFGHSKVNARVPSRTSLGIEFQSRLENSGDDVEK